MKNPLQARCQAFIENRAALKKAFRLENSRLYRRLLDIKKD